MPLKKVSSNSGAAHINPYFPQELHVLIAVVTVIQRHLLRTQPAQVGLHPLNRRLHLVLGITLLSHPGGNVACH